MTRRPLSKFTAILLGGLALSAPLALAQNADDTLVVAVPQSPSALEPVLRNNTSTLQTIYSVFDRLLTVDFRTGQVHPGLAESWERINPTTYEFTLREGVTFHDGTPLTVDDVVFSFSDDRIEGPDGSRVATAMQYHGTIDAVEAVDERTVRVITTQVDPTILIKLGGWGTEIVSKDAFEAMDGWAGWVHGPIATGPYRVVENRPDEFLILEAHEDYWRGAPQFDRIEFRVVPESVVRINGLLAGDFDMISFVAPDQIPQIAETEGFEVVGGPIQNVRNLSFFQTEGVFTDPVLRRAVSHAIDRQLIVDSIWQGLTEVAPGMQHPALGDLFIDDIEAPAYDPDLAREFIAQSSYNGELITYRTQTAAYPLELEAAQIILEMLRAVGLNVELQVVENWDQVSVEPIASILSNNSSLIAWPDPTGGLLRRYGPGTIHDRGAYLWRNDEFNTLANDFRVTDDLAQRQQMHRRMQEIWQVEDPAAVALFYNALFYGKRDDIA